MKKIHKGHFLILIVSLSACTLKENIALNGKEMIVEKLKGLKAPTQTMHISDTIHKEQLTGDFRYDYLLK